MTQNYHATSHLKPKSLAQNRKDEADGPDGEISGVEDLLKLAGFITLIDGFIAELPEDPWTTRQEDLWLRTLKPLGGEQETPEAFYKRVRG